MNNFNGIVQFIRNLYKEQETFIPLHAPVFNGNEKKYLKDCIDSTFVSSVGKYVDRFEEMVANYTGAKKAIVIVNGTNALHLALLVAGVKPKDEVITQPLTFIATANAIAYTGAKPVFIDVDKDTMGLSPKKLQNWLEENTTTNIKHQTTNKLTGRPITACIPMHTFGHPCRIDEIVDVCNEYNITVVEDAAESLGSFYKSKHTGTYGKLGVLSFNGNKTITTGGGGMILTNDEELGNHIKHLTTQAKVKHSWEFIHDHIGYNYRMPNINAAIGVAQMEQINEIIEKKRITALKYQKFFENYIPEIKFFTEPKYSKSNYWLNAILLDNRNKRDHFLEYTNKNGIMTRPVWCLMNKLDMFKECQKGDLTNAEWLEDRLVNIPSSVII